jgi:peptide subunit release factor 1 (eRF1)
MITRDEIRELAAFQADETKGALAVSFYFQPDPPQDRSHRRDAIVAKEVVKQALKGVNGKGKNGFLHSDIERILETANRVRGQSRGQAVFACGAQGLWKEFDLPPRLGKTSVFVQSRFHLQPLAALLGAQPSVCVAMVDRQRARFFDMRLDELEERGAIVHMLSRNATSYGYNGYDAGHAERRVAEEALQHFKSTAERLRVNLEKGIWERVIVGCQDSNWGEFEAQLHSEVKQKIVGRFSADVASVGEEDIRARASVLLKAWVEQRGRSKVEEAISFAKAHGRGVTGLRRVLQALEAGEVQALFLGQNYTSRAVECGYCGHLDAHLVAYCVACGKATRELDDVCDAIIPIAIRRDIELFYLKDHEGLDKAGNIAALLRFRADKSRGSRVAIAS